MMFYSNTCQYRRSTRDGLVLLVVLGMLGLFSLLAISYLTITGASRSSSQSLVRAKLQNIPTADFSEEIIRKIVRGDKNITSAFHGHSLLEDVYGRDPIAGTFATTTTTPPQAVTLNLANTVGFVSVNLNPRVSITPDTMRLGTEVGGESFLSAAAETYSGRLLTILDGPLKGQTYRILTYTGNEVAPNFSIIIDLSDTIGNASSDLPSNAGVTGGESIQSIVGSGRAARLFTTTGDTPYSFIINDLPFNGLGYGVELDRTHPNYGNLDQARVVPNTQLLPPSGGVLDLRYQPGRESFPIALLPNYDYLTSSEISGSLGLGQGNTEVNGSTNEGYDVADFRDYFLAHYQAASQTTGNLLISEITPSFHRPELVNYIFQFYGELCNGNPTALTQTQLIRMVTLIDYACARPLSYVIRNGSNNVLISKNPDFTGRNDAFAIPSLDIDFANWPGTEVNKLQLWVKALIAGGPDTVATAAWDIDNDGDLTADSVWVDPGLPIVTASDGKYLKALAATLILDMDGRVNVNVAGDRKQLDAGAAYRTRAQLGNDLSMSRVDPVAGLAQVFLPQGLGYGPADISLNHLFNNTLLGNRTNQVFNARYRNRETPFPSAGVYDSTNPTVSNDTIGRFFQQRGFFYQNDGRVIGLQQARRTRSAAGVDRLGNLRMSDSDVTGDIANDFVDDTYEVASLNKSGSDEMFELTELESILRRFDYDVSNLPDRLKSIFTTNVDTTQAIYKSLAKSITTRSVELRHPNLAALSLHQSYGGVDFPRSNFTGTATVPVLPVPTAPAERFVNNGRIDGSMMRWIQLLHAEKYPGAPRLSIADIRRLFPIEFQKLSKLDLNKSFGNGRDGSSDGQIDEPFELGRTVGTYAENISYPNQADTQHLMADFGFQYSGTAAIPGVTPDEKRVYVTSLDSRKVFARQLYCLAQLIVAPDYPFAGVSQSDGLALYQARRARELAQWAINVVDFRDNDAAMTRFEYDVNPFLRDGADTDVWVPKPGDVVWGMEFPELVLTETLAFHDKRVKNTRNDSNPSITGADKEHNPGNPMSDPSTDQLRTPQGSLFLEVFCPRSTELVNQPAGSNLGLPPSSLYDNSTNPPRLNLAVRAPDALDATNQNGVPVFRIGISEPYRSAPIANELNVTDHPANISTFADLHRLSFQTSEFSNSQSGANPFTTGLSSDLSVPGSRFFLDRIVWFANVSGATLTVPDLRPAANKAFRVYYNKAGTPVQLAGGQHLVIGPRNLTYIGNTGRSIASTDLIASPPTFNIGDPHQTINLQSASMVRDLAGINYPTPPNAGTPLFMVAATGRPTSWPTDIGINISEPHPTPTTHYSDSRAKYNLDPSLPDDIYVDPASVNNTLPDVPFDYDRLVNPILARSDIGMTDPDDRKRTGTYLNERVAYLQRLADPQLPYHEIFNPYITIDWMTIDLTVFNGEDTIGNDPEEGSTPTPTIAFQSRYKDGARVSDMLPSAAINPAPAPGTLNARLVNGTTAQTGVSVFSPSTASLWRSTENVASDAFFRYELGHANAAWKTASPFSSVSLGYLNVGRQNNTTDPLACDGFGVPAAATPGCFQGTPQSPQGGLTWLNRPFANPNELMMVPTTSPGQFSICYDTPRFTGGLIATGQYSVGTTIVPKAQLPKPFGYLPAFFMSDEFRADRQITAPFNRVWQTHTTITNSKGSDLSLLLELVETPPPYADEQRWIYPGIIQTGTLVGRMGKYLATTSFTNNYRTSGKINLNTLATKDTWDALEWNYDQRSRDTTIPGASQATWNAFQDARRGYVVPATPVIPPRSLFTNINDLNRRLNSAVPTTFTNPYQSGFSANIQVSPQPTVTAETDSLRKKRPVSVGVLRPQFQTTPPTADDPAQFSADLDPITLGTTANPRVARAASEQPFVNYQRMMRLPNLTTNQSNVFAVWITIGLFEYDPEDGIGREYVGPSGVPQRSKSFYVVDRSIPVGFAPGKQYNTDKTILLRRKVSE